MSLIIATTLLLSAAPETIAETRWRACVDNTKTNLDWAQCGGRYIQQADVALNVEWKRLMATVEGKTKADLVAEQRSWLAYRQTACRFWTNGEQGREGEVLQYQGCVAGAIERRTAELAEYRSAMGPD